MFGAGFRVHGSSGPWPRTPNREPRTEPRTKHPEPRTPPHRNEKRISERESNPERELTLTSASHPLVVASAWPQALRAIMDNRVAEGPTKIDASPKPQARS